MSDSYEDWDLVRGRGLDAGPGYRRRAEIKPEGKTS